HEPAQIEIALGQRFEHVSYLAIEEAEITRVLRNVQIRETIENLVESCEEKAHQKRRVTFAANSVSDVVALFPFLHELRNHRWRILEIGVHLHDRVAGRHRKAC